MRAAGCVVNDIFDKDIDVFVERTNQRPIAAGKIECKRGKNNIGISFNYSIYFIVLFKAYCSYFLPYCLIVNYALPTC